MIRLKFGMALKYSNYSLFIKVAVNREIIIKLDQFYIQIGEKFQDKATNYMHIEQ